MNWGTVEKAVALLLEFAWGMSRLAVAILGWAILAWGHRKVAEMGSVELWLLVGSAVVFLSERRLLK